MNRGPLFDDDYRPKLSGHETFPLRYGWLKKAFDAVEGARRPDGERPVFLDDDAIARFGVGKNMVASMRHWATSAEIIAEDGRTTTSLGRRLFGKNDGLDPYMEDPSTAWLVHWKICNNPRITTWFWAFSHYPATSFERGALVRGLEKLAREQDWRHASATTIRNDVACFLRTYTSQSHRARASHEDALESPLAELGLIRPTGQRDGFRFARGRKPTLGAGVIAYAVTEFWAGRSRAQTLSFEALAHEPGSPGRVFLLDEDALADFLFEIEDVSGGAYRWSETAGLKQLIREREVGLDQAMGFIAQDYHRHTRKVAA